MICTLLICNDNDPAEAQVMTLHTEEMRFRLIHLYKHLSSLNGYKI